MTTVTLDAEKRITFGKSSAKKLRSAGRIPASIYGMAQDPVSVSIDLSSLHKAYKTSQGRNVLIDLSIKDGDKTVSEQVISYEFEMDAISQEFTHIDFLRVKDDTPVEVNVRLDLIGQSPGVKMGGMLIKRRSRVTLSVLPQEIPDVVTLDLSQLKIGDSVRVKDLAELTGLNIVSHAEDTLVRIEAPRKAIEIDLDDELASGGEEGSSEEGGSSESGSESDSSES